MLTHPICILRPEDIPALVANNHDIVVKLLLSLFNGDEKDARQIEELLKKADLERDHNGSGSGSTLSESTESSTLVSEMVRLVNAYGSTRSGNATTTTDVFSPLRDSFSIRRYLLVLAELPPTIQSFSVIGKLLLPNSQASGEGSRRIATLVRTDVLGGFISGCIRWIEKEDRDEKEGRVHDDRVATATRNVSTL